MLLYYGRVRNKVNMEEQTYKYSKYNVVLDTDNENEVTIFNTYSSKYITISKEIYDEIKDETDLEQGDFPDYLIDLGIFVPNDLDELQLVKEENSKVVHELERLQFVIAGTSRCNYRCIYCFEKDHLGTCGDMDLKTQKGVVDFIIKECEKRPNLKYLNLQLFGGEPALVPEVFKNIFSQLKPYFTKRTIEFNSHIVTNGYLLTPELVDDLKESCHLVSAQITLDGLNPKYAELKGCSLDCFDKVIENIKAVQDKIHMEIRLNVSDNVETLKELISYIATIGYKGIIYIDNVRNYDNTPTVYEQVYDRYVVSDNELDTFIQEQGYKDLFRTRYNQICMRKCAACGANTLDYFVIDTKGNLYKCLDNVFNSDYIVGNIYDGITDIKENDSYINNPLKKECDYCEYLPVCAGYCTVETVKLPSANVCDARRLYLKRRIQRYLSGGGVLKVNVDNLDDLGKASGMFSPADLNAIMRAIQTYKHCTSKLNEIEDEENESPEEIAQDDETPEASKNTSLEELRLYNEEMMEKLISKDALLNDSSDIKLDYEERLSDEELERRIDMLFEDSERNI